MQIYDPVIEREGIDQNEPPRKRKKKIRKYSFLYLACNFIKALIITIAFLVVIGAAGNIIEFLARI